MLMLLLLVMVDMVDMVVVTAKQLSIQQQRRQQQSCYWWLHVPPWSSGTQARILFHSDLFLNLSLYRQSARLFTGTILEIIHLVQGIDFGEG